MKAKNLNELREFFKTKGLKQGDIAKSCDWPQSYVSEILNGKKKIGRETAVKLYNVYGVDIQWLLTGEGDVTNEQSNNIVVGDNNIAHNISSNINSSATIDNLVALLEKTHQDNVVKDEQIRKKDEQIDRLLSLLEKAQMQ